MVDRHATVALVWVNAAIAECLGAARKSLEHFAAEPGISRYWPTLSSRFIR